MATNTLIFGGSGKCARHITKLLAGQGHKVYSIIRNPDQKSDIESLGGTPIVQSIEDASVEDMAATIKSVQPSAILWCAGAGGGNPERTQAVDHRGAVRSMDAAAAAGVRRYVIISAVDVRDKEGGADTTPEWYDEDDRGRSDRVWKAIGPYMRAKLAADRSLVSENDRRQLEYTIVRPGGLNNEPATGKVAAGKVHLSNTISREDVAAVVVECLKQKDTIGLAIDCVGGDTPIAEAIAQAAKDRVNTFEGRY